MKSKYMRIWYGMNPMSDMELKREFQRLEDELSIVAYGFRGCLGDEECKKRAIEIYHSIFKRMIELGWASKFKLRDEDELPWNIMPQIYREMFPNPDSDTFFTENSYYTPEDVEYKPLRIQNHPLTFLQKLYYRLIRLFI
ncbi:MAG: hypothetical protein RLP44_08915 [Aggregatilineales bacterium]